MAKVNYKSFGDLANDIKANLPGLHKYNFDLVVGLPRSGMIPAYMIALYLNIDCTDITSFIENRRLKRGIIRSSRAALESPYDAKRILVVDDSIYTGKSMGRDLAQIPEVHRVKITSMAVYSTLEHRDDVDLFFEYLPAPRAFEWNVFHHDILENACVDIDGVLCVDPTEEQNDDGLNYRDFLLNAEPLMLPSSIIDSLVTSRLEKYRPETEKWLIKHNIQYRNLIMLDLATKEERIELKIHGKHKAEYYKKSDNWFFIESNPSQASEICLLTGKDVYCIEDNRIYNPATLARITKNPKGVYKEFKESFFRLYRFIKRLFIKT